MGTFFADPVDEDYYLSNFRAKAEKMQEFPDKRIIDALTGSAMRHSEDKSQEIADLLITMITDQTRPARHKLPLCYLVDSIVKNVNQPYTDLFEKGLVTWFCSAYDVVDEKSKILIQTVLSALLEARALARVVATWEVNSLFSGEKRHEIQRHIINGNAGGNLATVPEANIIAAAAPTNSTAHPPAPAPLPTLGTAVPPPPAAVILPPPSLAPLPAPQPVSAPQPVQSAPQPVQPAPQPAQRLPQPVQPPPQPVPAPQSVPPQPVSALQPVPPPAQPVPSAPQPATSAPQLAVAPLPLPPPPPQQGVAPAPAVPAVQSAPPEIEAMIVARMKNLLDQQLHELGESTSMSVDDLWRTNAELAQGFRLVAQAQVHEQLGMPPPPAPASLTVAPSTAPQPPIPHHPPPLLPAVQQAQPTQQQPQQQQPQPQPLPQPQPPPQPPQQKQQQQQQQQQIAIQLPLGTPPPWAAKAPPRQDLDRAVRLANEVTAGARAAQEASVRGDLAGGQVQAMDAAGKAAILTCLLGGEAAAWGVEVGIHLGNLEPFDVRALLRGNPVAVRRLYGEGFPFWCKQDGTRFAKQGQLDAHMDLLFRRKRARREQKSLISREWYCTEDQWLTDFGRLRAPAAGADDGEAEGDTGGEAAEGNRAEDKENGEVARACVPADDRFSRCRICGLLMDMFYDNDEEEWMYTNACYVMVRGNGGEEAWEEDDLGDGAGESNAGQSEGDGDGDADSVGEAAGRLRQIIVHKTCLDGSGLREKDEITWADLMPGTPRGQDSHADNGALDAQYSADEGGESDGRGRPGAIGTSNGEKRELEGREASTDETGGGPVTEGNEPPLKRIKAEGGVKEQEGRYRDASGVEEG